MLVIGRQVDDTIVIGGGMVTITVVRIEGNKVRLGIEAPKELIVDRGEIHERRRKETETYGNSN